MIMNEFFNAYKSHTVVKIGCAVLAVYLLSLALPLVFPIMLAIGLAFLLYPAVEFFGSLSFGDKKLPCVASILLALACFCTLAYLMFRFIFLPFFYEVNGFLHQLPDYMRRIDSNNYGWLGWDVQTRSELPANLLNLFDGLLSWSMSYLLGLLQSLVQSTVHMAIMLIGLIVVPFLTFYFLKDWQELRYLLISIFTYKAQPKVTEIIDQLGVVMGYYMRGIVQLSLLVGICIAGGTYLLGVNYPLILGFLAMLAEVVPIVGPIAVSIPAIFLAYTASPILALKIAAFYFVFYQIDANVLMPKIMGKAVQLHPVLLIISILLGAKLFGLLGLILAVPFAAVGKVLYQHLWHLDEEKE